MLISKKLLAEFIPEIRKISDEEIASKLTLQLAEVEGVTQFGSELKSIVLGEILSANNHPDADRLQVCEVKIGEGKTSTIVCGAPNARKGIRVAVALPGGQVYTPEGPLTITKRSIRGVESSGMLCSRRELGISKEHEGILEIEAADALELGSDLVAEISDAVFEIENKSITHRGDCFSHYGIARELSAIFDLEFKELPVPEEPILTESLPVEISVQTEKVTRFCAITLKGIEVKPAPFWLELALARLKLPSINNVVDVTNYYLALLGQPLHAYDYSQVKSNKLIAREAKSGEEFTGIDHKKYQLEEGDIAIADTSKLLGLAGVIGGSESEITLKTSDVILEAANFDPEQILQTSRKQGVYTEAGIRFSKGVNSDATAEILKRVVHTLQTITGGEVGSELLDIYPSPAEPGKLEVDLRWVESIIGANVDRKQVLGKMNKLGLTSTTVKTTQTATNMVGTPEVVEFKIPNWRKDLKIEADFAEEVARLHGYDNIAPRLPQFKAKPAQKSDLQKLLEIVRRVQVGLGFTELITYSFIPNASFDDFGLKANHALRVENAISPELKYVRSSLVPSLIAAAVKNINLGRADLDLFEIGRRIDAKELKIANPLRETEQIPSQNWHLGLVSVREEATEAGFLELKGALEQLLASLNISAASEIDNETYEWQEFNAREFPHLDPDCLHPGRKSQLLINNKVCGWVGQIHPLTTEKFTATTAATKTSTLYGAEIDLEKIIIEHGLAQPNYVPLAKFQEVSRDVSFEIGSKKPIGEVLQFLRKTSPELKLKDVTVSLQADLLDEYRSKESENRYITLRFNLTPKTETLTEDQINDAVNQINSKLVSKFSLKVRN